LGQFSADNVERRKSNRTSNTIQAAIFIVIFIDARATTLMNLKARLSGLLIREIQKKKKKKEKKQTGIGITRLNAFEG